MPIDKISFKNNNNFEQFKPVSNSPQVLKPVQQQKNDTFGISDKQKDLITYSSIVAGILLLIGLIKRKLITEFFSKLLKKREIPEITKTKPVEPSKQKNLETIKLYLLIFFTLINFSRSYGFNISQSHFLD